MSSFDEDPVATAERDHDREPASNSLLRASTPLVSDLEQEVLEEYTRLLGNVNKPAALQLSDKLADLAGNPTSLTLDGLRLLERKTATVCTLLKASVYSIVLQQQIFNESEQQQQQQAEEEEERRLEEQQRGFGGGYEGDMSFTGRYM
ncbi:DASH complex subunit DAD3 family protein [Aspergillus clavatus NRRL 1]|uniref:DASH complex subunit DAD3 n=1 Tax=Aspergillus clavatus (strain ATCC 1007 / CBS 513.65 / DSM 816 / NCTC 3887 / NRRL 1 / QM 1276 / 107) TaxID=344612 RepID=A1CBA5_ASPCL|nr:uncharacterized protein ACLA_014600 [Aspergillus clavatus NRRL 1]EAW13023.1 conserved hypothetical protein [Aspergillus clavatus NRRL 1]